MKLPAKPSDLMKMTAMVLSMAVVGMIAPKLVPYIDIAENWSADLRTVTFSPPSPSNDEIVIVSFTEETLATLPYRSPVDRGFMAELLGQLEEKGVRAIVLDVLFDQPTEPGKDLALQRRMKSLKIPLVVAWSGRGPNMLDSQVQFLNDYLVGIDKGLPNLTKDGRDGTVRWIFPGGEVDGTELPGLAGAIAAKIDAAPPKEITPLVYRVSESGGPMRFKTFPAHLIASIPADWLAGKIIFIGADLPLQDRHRTPFASIGGISQGEMPGVYIHALSLAQIMGGYRLPELSVWQKFTIMLLLSLIGLGLAIIDLGIWPKLFLNVLVVGGLWGFGFAVFRTWGAMIPMIPSSMVLLGSFGIGNSYLRRWERLQRKFIRQAFSHYIAPAVVDQIASNPDQLKLGGEKRELTVLFCDVRRFTTISEQFDATGLTHLINELLTPLTDVILSNQGTVDKYMGDCIMAFWNAPMDDENHALNGCLSALKMIEEMGPLNQRLEAEAVNEGRSHIPLQVGLGINTGECVVGNMGSKQRFDYSALGDAVNLASRLEGQSKNYGADIVIGQATREKVPELAALELDFIQLKGKTEGVLIYALLGDREVAQSSGFKALDTANQGMITAYRAQKWDEAREYLAKCRSLTDGFAVSGLYDLYESRVAEYEINPPPAGWNGVFIATAK